MLAARDQENLVHARQTTAAGKPLNQGIRGLQPKTPGNKAPKTPFKVSLNDENKPLAFNGQRTGLRGLDKGHENILQTGKRDGKLDNNAFITPLRPRTRAPLGIKTTNAKAGAFQTPAPQQTIKPEKTNWKQSTSRKAVKSKITVAPSEPVNVDILNVNDDDVPEIEYAPPPPVELPDPPEDFEYDQTFPQFQGRNFCRGWQDVYGEQKDEHGVPLRLKKYEKECAQYDRDVERQIEESLMNLLNADEELDKWVDAMIEAGPKDRPLQDSKVDSLRARGAAAALSQSKVPSAAMKPTASSLQKRKNPALSVLGSKNAPGPTNPSPMRQTAAAVVSKNTIGFPNARKPPSIVPRHNSYKDTKNVQSAKSVKRNQMKLHPTEFQELFGEPPAGSEMWLRLREHENRLKSLESDDAFADSLDDTNFFALEGEDEEVFQLAMPS